MSDSAMLKIGRLRLIRGFARGHYVRSAPRIKFKRLAVGPKASRGWSLQLHLSSGIRYLDLVLFKRSNADDFGGMPG